MGLKGKQSYLGLPLYKTRLFFSFLWPHLWYMEIPRLGTESEMHLPTYAMATVSPDPIASAIYATSHGNARSLTH